MQNLIARLLGFYINLLSFISPKLCAKHGFNIFCYPFKIKFKPYQLEFLNAAKQVKVPFNNISLMTYRWGDGPKKLLLLHGWRSHSFRWKKLIASVDKNKYTIIALDAPGHGNSEGKILNIPLYADAIHTVLQNEPDIKHVISHSIGSLASLFAFYSKPELSPEKLVLIGSPGEASDFVNTYKAALKLSNRSMGFIEDYFIKTIGQNVSYFSAARFSKKQIAKGFILHDLQDKDTDAKYSKIIHENWGNSKLELTNGYGHKMNAKEITSKIMAFID